MLTPSHWCFLSGFRMSEIVLPNKKADVWSCVAPKAKLVRQMLVCKEISFIQVLCDLGEWKILVSKLISSARPRQFQEFLLQCRVETFEAHSQLLSAIVLLQVA